jgi:hypothetical protein
MALSAKMKAQRAAEREERRNERLKRYIDTNEETERACTCKQPTTHEVGEILPIDKFQIYNVKGTEELQVATWCKACRNEHAQSKKEVASKSPSDREE